MKKNGIFFISVVSRDLINPGLWDPYEYRSNAKETPLGNYIKIEKPKVHNRKTAFRPLEYRDIPKDGFYISYALKRITMPRHTALPMAEEKSLLFGTLRAYLGNVVVTPEEKWIKTNGSIEQMSFPIKSEFIKIIPSDGYYYFWWYYFKSDTFLKNIPLGGGGTRPRLQVDSFMKTPTFVPDIKERRRIHNLLLDEAKKEWMSYNSRVEILETIDNKIQKYGKNNGEGIGNIEDTAQTFIRFED